MVAYGEAFGVDPQRVEATISVVWFQRWLMYRKATAARRAMLAKRSNPDYKLSPDEMRLVQWIQSDE